MTSRATLGCWGSPEGNRAGRGPRENPQLSRPPTLLPPKAWGAAIGAPRTPNRDPQGQPRLFQAPGRAPQLPSPPRRAPLTAGLAANSRSGWAGAAPSSMSSRAAKPQPETAAPSAPRTPREAILQPQRPAADSKKEAGEGGKKKRPRPGTAQARGRKALEAPPTARKAQARGGASLRSPAHGERCAGARPVEPPGPRPPRPRRRRARLRNRRPDPGVPGAPLVRVRAREPAAGTAVGSRDGGCNGCCQLGWAGFAGQAGVASAVQDRGSAGGAPPGGEGAPFPRPGRAGRSPGVRPCCLRARTPAGLARASWAFPGTEASAGPPSAGFSADAISPSCKRTAVLQEHRWVPRSSRTLAAPCRQTRLPSPPLPAVYPPLLFLPWVLCHFQRSSLQGERPLLLLP